METFFSLVVIILELSDKRFAGQTTNEICFQVVVNDDGTSGRVVVVVMVVVAVAVHLPKIFYHPTIIISFNIMVPYWLYTYDGL